MDHSRPHDRPASPPAPPPVAACLDGPTLCAVRVLSEAQWAALPESERPARAEFVPGLGWVVAVPVEHLN